jgi:hypothetical protein
MSLILTKGPGEVVAEILMSRAAFAGSFLVVEGEDDSRLWRKFTAPEYCEIVIAGGKPCALESMVRLGALNVSGVVSVVDDDYDGKLRTRLNNPNVVYTDENDTEIVLLRSSALDRVLAEFVDQETLTRLEREIGSTIRQAVASRAAVLGRLRFFSKKDNVAISFGDLSCHRVCLKTQWEIDVASIAAIVSAAHPTIKSDDLIAIMTAKDDQDPWTWCQGHDAVDLLVIGMQEKFRVRQVGRELLARYLRIAFNPDDLCKTAMYRAIVEWENNNGPSRVFRSSIAS